MNFLQQMLSMITSLFTTSKPKQIKKTIPFKPLVDNSPVIVVTPPEIKEIQTFLKVGDAGPAVEDLQIKLCGFHGTVWDGDFGQGTTNQIIYFQKLYMKLENPSGEMDLKTDLALKEFDKKYRVDLNKLKCPCGVCDGFGQGRFKGEYREGQPKVEAYHLYEYPGIHKSIIYMIKFSTFISKHKAIITAGYRCEEDNIRISKSTGKPRQSNNHKGKAVDQDFLSSSNDRKVDMEICDDMRSTLVEHSNCQIKWNESNKKALEPSDIAPTWVHLDVRQYSSKYLDDKFFINPTKLGTNLI